MALPTIQQVINAYLYEPLQWRRSSQWRLPRQQQNSEYLRHADAVKPVPSGIDMTDGQRVRRPDPTVWIEKTCRCVAVLIMFALAQLIHPQTLAAAEGKRPWPDDRAMEAAKVRAKQVVNEDVERQRREERGACGAGPKLDPFEIWKDVTGPADAARLLRHHYGRIRSIEAMADWLRCQGFHATVMHGPFQRIKNSDQKIAAGFVLPEHGGRPLWKRLLPWPPIYSHSFGIYFDKRGELLEIEAGYTVE